MTCSKTFQKTGIQYAVPRPGSPDRPDDAEEQLQQRLEAAFDESDDDTVTDVLGGGFLDEAWPRTTDNSRRLWSVDKPTIEKETPATSFDYIVSGFYAVLGDSVVECKDDPVEESVANFSHSLCQKTPDRPIIVVCNNLSCNIIYYIDNMIEERNIIMIALLAYSPDLNPSEQIWKRVKRDLSPRDVSNLDTYRSMISGVFHDYADRLSFADPGLSASYLSKTYDYYRPLRSRAHHSRAPTDPPRSSSPLDPEIPLTLHQTTLSTPLEAESRGSV